MKIWSAIQKKLNLLRSASKATKITENFSNFEKWTNKDLIYIAQIFKGPTLK